ncbi:ribonuclease pancreatic-like [Talpa occidentalis]|uniref:ribonuclease pancreatic-like n=1 Tax=Talpa occidentalis TaxID=50954 RepID=UPI00188E165D|nr:ribonuclease pancreatic-like [Talpa occidentalis]
MDTRNGSISSNYCNDMMRDRKLLKRKFNTFVHAPWKDVQDICLEPTILCRDGRQINCHKSKAPVSITECSQSPEAQTPDYKTNSSNKFITIACSEMLEPIHFDDSWPELLDALRSGDICMVSLPRVFPSWPQHE